MCFHPLKNIRGRERWPKDRSSCHGWCSCPSDFQRDSEVILEHRVYYCWLFGNSLLTHISSLCVCVPFWVQVLKSKGSSTRSARKCVGSQWNRLWCCGSDEKCVNWLLGLSRVLLFFISISFSIMSLTAYSRTSMVDI